MARRPKDIGTEVETASVKALHRLGFEGAERRVLYGAQDKGDVLVCPGVIAECKGGKAAETASDGLIAEWLNETERERVHARADVALLILKRKAVGKVNAHRWWAFIVIGGDAVGCPDVHAILDRAPRFLLQSATHLLRGWGYGSPLD